MPANPAVELLRSLLSDDRLEAEFPGDDARSTSITMNINRLQIGQVHITTGALHLAADGRIGDASNAAQTSEQPAPQVPEPSGARVRPDGAVQFFPPESEEAPPARNALKCNAVPPNPARSRSIPDV